MNLQHDTTKLREGESSSQLDLLGGQPSPSPVTKALIVAQPSMLKALQLAQLAANLDDKKIYGPLGIDKHTWSRIKSGDANFPTNADERFMKVVDNDIPLIWLAHRRGFELVPMRSALERENAELRAQLRQERHDREIEREYARQMQGSGSRR